MLKLSDILDAEQNRRYIIEQAVEYGFDENVLFFVDDSRSGMLYLLVSEKNEKIYQSAFKAVVSDKFKCTIDILVDTKLDELLASTVLNNSISLQNYDRKAIETKLGKNLDQIKVDKLEDPNDIFMINRGLGLAQRLKKQKKDALSSDEDLETKKKIGKFIEEIKDPRNAKILAEVLTSLPEEMLLMIQEQYTIKRENSDEFSSSNSFFKKPDVL